jgi:hypothetical protein
VKIQGKPVKICRLAFGFCFFVISTSVLGNKKAAIGLAKQNIVFIGQDKTLSFKDLQIFHSTDNSKRPIEKHTSASNKVK